MFKLTYLIAFLTVTALLSCEKKVATPATTHTNPPNLDTNSGKIFTIAGNGIEGYSGNGGQATAAELAGPVGVVVDGSGNIYIADCENCLIRKVNTNGIISNFAGVRYLGYSGDGGAATAAELDFPYGLALDGLGNLYIADQMNYRIRKVNTSGIISTIAGNGTSGYSGDGGVAIAAELGMPYGLAIDGSGNVYIGDLTGLVRKVNFNGIITTFAGHGLRGYSGDGGPATAAELYNPEGVAVDGLGNVYIADYTENRIRVVNTAGIISTFAGNGYGYPIDGGYAGDGGPAAVAELYKPTDVIVDGSGNVYIYDAENFRIRMVNTGGIISTIVGNGIGAYRGDGGAATAASIGFGYGISLDGSGNLYISDNSFNCIRVVYK